MKAAKRNLNNSALLLTALGGAGNAASFADGLAAPSGLHWEFITDDMDGSRITDDVTSQPVVDLVAN